MLVLTADQKGSRGSALNVADAAELATNRIQLTKNLPRPEVTVGDELQAVFNKPGDLVVFIQALQEVGDWHLGVGIGKVELKAGVSIRFTDGPAFWSARTAVELAKKQGAAILGGAEPARAQAQAVLRAIEHLAAARTVKQRETIAAYRQVAHKEVPKGVQKIVAQKLAVTEQSVSKTLARAAMTLEEELAETLTQLLEQADA